MGLNIKNPDVESNIRKLAERTGETLTDAIDNAVRERLARLEDEAAKNRPAQTVEEFLARIKPLQDAVADARRKSGDSRSVQELMDDLYDENGLPR